MFTRILAALTILAAAIPLLHAAEVFHHVPVSELIIHDGQLNPDVDADDSESMDWQRRRVIGDFLFPQVRLDGGDEEAYLRVDGHWNAWQGVDSLISQLHVVTRTQEGTPVTGVLVLPQPNFQGMHTVRFQVPNKTSSGNERQAFYEAKKSHYQRLLNLDAPGAAWFRHQINAAEAALAGDAAADTAPGADPNQRRARESELRETYHLFTGGRAISENIQLDRELMLRGNADQEQIDLATIPGIDTAAIDWRRVVKDMKPALDPTAALVPEDQHALFFPSFQGMTTVIDEAKANGTPILRLLDPRSEDAQSQERYEQQLGVSLDAIARQLGPHMVSSLAVTGSDPYMRTGTDFAVIFECSQAKVFHALLAASQQNAALAAGVEVTHGSLGERPYSVAVTPDRRLSSYLMQQGDFVVLTNSQAQLERISEAMTDQIDAIADSLEYIFFRDRYPLGNDDETAFLVLTDAAIRRWCSPKWRIGASRRLRAAAVMAEIQARWIMAQKNGGTVQIPAEWRKDFGLTLTDKGVRSDIYNTLEFLTPIIELEISKVSEAERDAYNWFRSRYQREWREVFDPIAASLSLQGDKLEADLTVRPLIGSSEYRQIMDVVGSVKLAPEAGNPHKNVLAQFILSLDSDSEPVQQAGNFLATMAPNIKSNALNWIGDWFTVFAEDDPFWGELAAAMEKGEDEMEEFMEKSFTRLPVAIAVDVRNPFTLTTFLAAAHGFIEQTAPGMLTWNSLKHGDLPYVRVAPSIQALDSMPEEMANIAVYYAAMPDMLLLTLSENVVKAALDRKAGRADTTTTEASAKLQADENKVEWLGESMAWRSDGVAFKLIETMAGESMALELQTRAWGNLFILNEWRREFTATDPVAFHARHWNTRLVCPGGGEYVWNESDQTMESTVFGHPGAPKIPENLSTPLQSVRAAGFGITFEGDGLRARTRILRQ